MYGKSKGGNLKDYTNVHCPLHTFTSACDLQALLCVHEFPSMVGQPEVWETELLNVKQ